MEKLVEEYWRNGYKYIKKKQNKIWGFAARQVANNPRLGWTPGAVQGRNCGPGTGPGRDSPCSNAEIGPRLASCGPAQ